MLYPAELRVRGEAPLRASARGRNPLFQLYDRLTERLRADGVRYADSRRLPKQYPDRRGIAKRVGARDFGAGEHCRSRTRRRRFEMAAIAPALAGAMSYRAFSAACAAARRAIGTRYGEALT